MSYNNALAAWLKQSVTWSRKTGVDAYNKPTYTNSTIAARKEKRNRTARTITNEQVISSTTVFTQSEIGYGDEIDNEKVIQIMDMVDGEGSVIGYEVLL